MMQSKNTRVIKLILVVLVATFLVSCRKETTTWDRIQQIGVLKVGLDPTFPPFEVFDGSDVRGIDVDVSESIARELDLNVEFVHFGYDGLYDALATNQVDVLISALVVAPERTRNFSYSDSYFNAGQVMITSRNGSLSDWTNLDGRIIAVELGAEGHVTASSWQRQQPTMSIQVHESAEKAVESVAAGDADAAIVDHVSARLIQAQSTDLIILQQPITVEPYAFVVRAEDTHLLDELNSSLNSLQVSGQLDAIITGWLES